MNQIDQKYRRLLEIIGAEESVAVAFSGGVDSSFLAFAAHAALAGRAVAVTIVSPMLPQSEIEDARRVAALIGIEHVLLQEEGIDPEVAANPRDRCYHCKKLEFGAVREEARRRGLNTVLDGSNVDDLTDWRPGLRALEELGVKSPLRLAGLGKEEIRALSRRYNLPTWDKPAFACLASRIPYGEGITREKLFRVEAAEALLRDRGFRQFRVRSHGDIARIEAAPEERVKFFDLALLDSLSREIKALGFVYVALELEGYRMGSMNRAGGENGGKGKE